RKLYEFRAKEHTPVEPNPLNHLLLPNAPEDKRPTPETIFFESHSEMALLSGKTKVLRTRRQPRRRRRTIPTNQDPDLAAANNDNLDDHMVDPADLPPLEPVGAQN